MGKWHKWLTKLIAIAVILMASLCLPSCQSPNYQGIPKQSQASAPIHLTLWQGINPPPNREVFNRLVDKFNHTHTDIQVESIFAGDLDRQLPKVLTSVLGKSPPDILAFYPQVTGQFIELDAIRPLEDLLARSPVKDEVIPSLLNELTLEGHLWSVPLYTSNLAIFYRDDIFATAGIEKVPATWEELRLVAKQLTRDLDGDGKLDRHGILLPLGKGEWTVFSWFPFLLSANGNIVQQNRPNLLDRGTIDALTFWYNLIKDGSAMLSNPERGYEEDAFLSGKVAMQITGPWTYITKSKVSYKTMPIPQENTRSSVTGTGNLFIMKTTPDRERVAFKFLEFVLSESFQTEWSIGTGFLPVNQKSVDSSTYRAYIKERPWLQTFVDQVPQAKYRPIIPKYSLLSDNLGRAIEATLLGKSQPQAALEQAQHRLDLAW
jgi:multiple sugar transport system substrate-binding protein